MPEAVALSLFGAIAALALLVLVGQGLVQMINRSAPDIAVLRALGATRGQAAATAAGPGLISVLGGVALAVAVAVATSPLAPVGPVRRYDPDRGISTDGLVLGTGAAVLLVALLGLLAMVALRSVRARTRAARRRLLRRGPRSGRAGAAGRCGRRHPQRARARIRGPGRPGALRALRLDRGRHRGSDSGGVQRQPRRADLPSGPVRLELGPGHPGRGPATRVSTPGRWRNCSRTSPP